ncbi:MAG: hypothetical protein KAQ68_00055 [Clostridiales bacterium]|nr:hypothetical protein [Clostridiales bacterium]
MDNFLDVIFVREKRGLYNLLYYLASLVMVLLGITAAVTLSFVYVDGKIDVIYTIIFVLSAGLAFLIYWQRGNIRIDYDISFTNGFVEIAQVANNTKRKELVKFNMKDVEVAELASSPNYNRYTSMKNYKKIKVFLNKDSKKFFIVVRVQDATHLITMEYNKELVELMKQYNPRIVKVD